MSKNVAFHGSVVLVLAALASAGSLRADDNPPKGEDLLLCPLKKGLKWEYLWTVSDGKDVTDKNVRDMVEVGDTVLCDNRECYEMITRYSDRSYSNTSYLAVEDGFLTNAGNADIYYRPGDKLLRLGKEERATWVSKWKYFVVSIKGEEFGDSAECSQAPDVIKLDGAEKDAVLVVRVTHEGRSGRTVRCKLKTWYIHGKGMVKAQYFEDDQLQSEKVLVSFNGGAAVAIGSVTLNPDEVEKEASVESVEAPAGVVTEFKKSRTITREVSYSTKVGAEAAVEAQLSKDLLLVKGELALKVKASVEADRGEKLSDSETREQTVKIDGDKLPKAKIVWIDVYRTGTVDVKKDGQTYKVPFQFPMGTKLVIRKP